MKLLLKEAGKNVVSNLVTGVAIIYVIFAIIAYMHIITIIKKSRNMFGKNFIKNNKSHIKNDFITPGLIILTYIVLYGIPTLIIRNVGAQYMGQKSKTIIRDVCKFIMSLGLCVDPILYVLLTKTYRERIVNLLQCLQCWPGITTLRRRTITKVKEVDGAVDEGNQLHQTTL